MIVKDLALVRSDRRNFDADVRDKASEHLTSIKGKFFLVILNFLYDVLEHLSYWFKGMHNRAALLVDFVDFKDKISQTFESLKTQNGKGLNLLLENSVDDAGTCETIGDYYDSVEVTYMEVPLLNDRGTETESNLIPYLHEIRNSFLENIKIEINKYFPMKDLTLKKLIRCILVLPIADAERGRGFSIMNHIKYDRRSPLGQKKLGRHFTSPNQCRSK